MDLTADTAPAIDPASLTPAAFPTFAEAVTEVAFEDVPRPRPSQKIFLVEDEAFVRRVTAEILASAGYEVWIARCAEEALENPSQYVNKVDLLLADVVMPGMSGRELAREFVALHPRARVLLMTGYAEQLIECESAAGEICLPKPFSTQILLQRVREALDIGQPRPAAHI